MHSQSGTISEKDARCRRCKNIGSTPTHTQKLVLSGLVGGAVAGSAAEAQDASRKHERIISRSITITTVLKNELWQLQLRRECDSLAHKTPFV